MTIIVPGGCIVRAPYDPKRGHIATWWTIPAPPDLNWLSVTLAEAVVLRDKEFPSGRHELPRRVETLIGFQWTQPHQLRRAARMLEAAAVWLERPAVDRRNDGGEQLALLHGPGRAP